MSRILYMPHTSLTIPWDQLPMIIDWTPVPGLIPCQIQLGPTYEPCDLFSGQKPQGNGMLIAMADGMTIMYTS